MGAVKGIAVFENQLSLFSSKVPFPDCRIVTRRLTSTELNDWESWLGPSISIETGAFTVPRPK